MSRPLINVSDSFSYPQPPYMCVCACVCLRVHRKFKLLHIASKAHFGILSYLAHVLCSSFTSLHCSATSWWSCMLVAPNSTPVAPNPTPVLSSCLGVSITNVSQSLCGEGLVASLGKHWEMVEPSGMGAELWKLDHWGDTFEGDNGNQPIPVPLCFLANMSECSLLLNVSPRFLTSSTGPQSQPIPS